MAANFQWVKGIRKQLCSSEEPQRTHVKYFALQSQFWEPPIRGVANEAHGEGALPGEA
jgi:hypothetical protein